MPQGYKNKVPCILTAPTSLEMLKLSRQGESRQHRAEPKQSDTRAATETMVAAANALDKNAL
jgi:hypothetical protein